ncbi:5b5d540c-439b-4d71-866b-8314cb4ede48 [Thermothielavioides terrestris]|nr:5b5d540c-439b-4d71-866b-8314cb4ede48 [Thermothielavioides terrestris]
MIQKEALKKKFPEGWNPRKKLSPDALVGIRMLHKQFPEEYTTEVLAQKFEVSPEAIRRILKSKWNPDPDEEMDRQRRWFNRGKRVWTHWAALGKKPPRKWRAVGIVRDPSWNIPRGPTHKDKAARAEAQRRLAKGMLG